MAETDLNHFSKMKVGKDMMVLHVSVKTTSYLKV